MYFQRDKLKTIFLSTSMETIDELTAKHKIKNFITVSDLTSLAKAMQMLKEEFILIADFDSVSSEINQLISLNKLAKNTIVLEKNPEIISGRMLISHKVKAYANTRISEANFLQMIEAVSEHKVWTYPELTMALSNDVASPTINDDAKKLIQNRLSPKELEVIYFILDGLTNNAISQELNITTRTVKAHVSSIFSKLHVNDRLALVLLLK